MFHSMSSKPAHYPSKIMSAIKRASLTALVVAPMMLWGLPAIARRGKVVILHYDSITTTVPLREVQNLVESGELSVELQEYFDSIPIDADTSAAILDSQIFDEGLPLGQRDLQFLAIQVTRKIGDPLRRERLDDMEAALRSSFANNGQITLLEVVEHYPDSTVRIDFKQLNRLRDDVKRFVERIEPVLNVVEQLLPELVCECEFDDARVATLEESSLSASTDSLIELPLGSTSINTNQENRGADNNCQAQLLENYSLAIAHLKALTEYNTDVDGLHNLVQQTSTVHRTVHRDVVNISISDQLIAQEPSAPSQSNPALRLPSPIAKNIVIAVGPIRPSFAIRDLENFAETGTVPNGWRFFFNVAGVNAEEFQTALTEEVDVDVLFIDKLLNSILGEFLLFQVGQIIHTPSQDANIQALRSAIIISSVDDGKISLLEFLRNYPSSDVIIQALNLARFGRNIENQGLVGTKAAGLEDMLLELQAGVADDICDCEQMER